MGGSAFKELFTPRMPPDVYYQAIADCHAKLRDLYVITATPVEAPAKKDHGDIDILVAIKKPSPADATEGDATTSTSDLLQIRDKLQASACNILSPPVAGNFAIPWPASPRDMNMESSETQEQQDPEQRFIQVDVRICNSGKQVDWALFKHAHGDLWNILGSIIRPYGLTVDEEALWIRIPEIEKYNKKKAKVKLTDEPAAVIDLLGMKYEGFWDKPFESVDALYEYAATCRLFLVRDASAGAASDPPDGGPGVIGGVEGHGKLKSNDRRRMQQRSVYRDWINRVVPKLFAEGRFVCKDPDATIPKMRAMVRDQAFERFSSAERDYGDRLNAWRQETQIPVLKRLIKELAPAAPNQEDHVHYQSIASSALRKIILDNDRSFCVYPTSSLKGEDGLYDVELVRTFIAEKGLEVGQIAWREQLARSMEALKAKNGIQRAQDGVIRMNV